MWVGDILCGSQNRDWLFFFSYSVATLQVAFVWKNRIQQCVNFFFEIFHTRRLKTNKKKIYLKSWKIFYGFRRKFLRILVVLDFAAFRNWSEEPWTTTDTTLDDIIYKRQDRSVHHFMVMRLKCCCSFSCFTRVLQKCEWLI